jgi:hypothetical protein
MRRDFSTNGPWPGSSTEDITAGPPGNLADWPSRMLDSRRQAACQGGDQPRRNARAHHEILSGAVWRGPARSTDNVQPAPAGGSAGGGYPTSRPPDAFRAWSGGEPGQHRNLRLDARLRPSLGLRLSKTLRRGQHRQRLGYLQYERPVSPLLRPGRGLAFLPAGLQLLRDLAEQRHVR